MIATTKTSLSGNGLLLAEKWLTTFVNEEGGRVWTERKKTNIDVKTQTNDGNDIWEWEKDSAGKFVWESARALCQIWCA